MYNKEICESRQIVMNENDAARVYYERGDLVTDEEIMIHQVGNKKFMFSYKEDLKQGLVRATGKPCIFYNQEKGECGLDEKFRPSSCRGGEELSMSGNGLNLGFVKMPKWDKKELKKRMKNFKEDLVLYSVLWQIQAMLNNKRLEELEDKFKVDYLYKLTQRHDGKINAIRYTKLIALQDEYKIIAKLHNYLARVYSTTPVPYIEMIIEKLNKLFSGVTLKPCGGDDVNVTAVDSSAIYFAILYRFYNIEFKNKSEKHKSIVPIDDVYMFLKCMNTKYNPEGKEIKMFSMDNIKCFIDNGERLYNAIMKNK